MIPKHICHARLCDEPTNPKLFMCSLHWTMLPTALQVPIRTHFHPDQCKPITGRRPTKEWLKAARVAINYIAEKEGLRATAHQSEGQK